MLSFNNFLTIGLIRSTSGFKTNYLENLGNFSTTRSISDLNVIFISVSNPLGMTHKALEPILGGIPNRFRSQTVFFYIRQIL